MGEPTCLLQQPPFSYAAGIPSHANEADSVHGLGQSVSFGRFMSETLAWEKWSSFSHNRYVEEAERFSRPGSVAQKKAFFEAHYKNLAARKAAALLEQANAAAAAAAAADAEPEPEVQTEVKDGVTQDSEQVTTNSGLEFHKHEVGFVADDNGKKLNLEMENSESKKVEHVRSSTENRAVLDDKVKVKPSSQITLVNYKEEVKEVELSETTLMEKPLLKNFFSERDDSASMSKKKPETSSSKSLISGRASKFPCTPSKPAAASIRARKETNATPISRKHAMDSMDRKKATPKSNHKSMNFPPVREINRITSTIIRKIDNSGVISNSKASKDCPSTPLRTPSTASVLRGSKHPLATPQSENRRAKTPIHSSASASKTVRPKWRFLPTDCSKLISACRNKSESPNLSTPFNLRTEERAARRKERLEEKFNANQAEKVLIQATLKEKAETEIKKLRQSLCFKARPLPNFYKERKATKVHMEKVPLTQPESPNPERTLLQSMGKTACQPSPKPSINNSGSKLITGKKNDNPRSLAARFRASTLENTSPNIQHRRAA